MNKGLYPVHVCLCTGFFLCNCHCLYTQSSLLGSQTTLLKKTIVFCFLNHSSWDLRPNTMLRSTHGYGNASMATTILWDQGSPRGLLRIREQVTSSRCKNEEAHFGFFRLGGDKRFGDLGFGRIVCHCLHPFPGLLCLPSVLFWTSPTLERLTFC